MATRSLIHAVEPLAEDGKTEQATILDVSVQFDVSTLTITLWLDSKQVEVIPVQRGLTKINFELQTVGGSGSLAAFASAPILWIDPQSKLPRPIPPAITPILVDSTHLIVWDFNHVESITSFPFIIAVEYQGAVYFEDPSIANQPPT